MTKPELEAAVNTLLAPGQPITANGQHKPSMQQIINELYDAVSRGKVLATVDSVVSLTSGDQVFIVRSGEVKRVDRSVFGGVNGGTP